MWTTTYSRAKTLAYGPANLSHVPQLVFSEIYDMARPLLRDYASDLYHDALWLTEHCTGRDLRFYWSVNDGGTLIGTDTAALSRADTTGRGYRLTLTIKPPNNVHLTIDTMTRAEPTTPPTATYRPGDLLHDITALLRIHQSARGDVYTVRDPHRSPNATAHRNVTVTDVRGTTHRLRLEAHHPPTH